MRLSFVQAALLRYCHTWGLWRLHSVLAASNEDRLKTILHVVTISDEIDDTEPDIRKAFRDVYGHELFRSGTREWIEETARFFELASDVLSWDGGDDEFQRYVRPAWWTFTDEIEFTEENRCDEFQWLAEDQRWRANHTGLDAGMRDAMGTNIVTTCQHLVYTLHHPFAMNAKRATLRLFVAVTGLLASLLELAGAFVRLFTTGLRLGTVCLERLTNRARGPVTASVAPVLSAVPLVAVAAHPARVAATATVAMSGDERLTSALLSLKFPVAKVRAFAASVQGREAPLEVLVKEGIMALSSPGPTHQVLS
jgi:hypothetical protein